MIKPEWIRTTRSEYRWWPTESKLMYHIEGPDRTCGQAYGLFTATRRVMGKLPVMVAAEFTLKEARMKVLQDYEEWQS